MPRSDDDGAADAATRPLRAASAPATALEATMPSEAKAAAEPLATTLAGDAPRPAVDGLTSIGRFEIQRKLGEGGMGVVYLATDPALGRRVAIKILHRDGGDTPAARRRLLREAQATAQLAHEHVVVVHEVGTHEDHVFLAMEYVAGTTLKAWQTGRDWREILAMYQRAGTGLLAAHAVGLVHRDFKPDNVLVGDDGRVRVTDFGLVAAIDDGSLALSHDAATLRGELDLAVSMTRTGSILGTPRYMAPEQHLGESVDARADQFAFCASLYEAWYGRPPFAAPSYDVLVAQVLAGEVQPVPETAAPPAPLRDAVVRGLSRHREARFATMQDLLAALVEPIASAPAPPRARWPWLVGGAGALAALAVTVALVVSGGDGASTRRHDPLDDEIVALRDPAAGRDRRLAAVDRLARSTDERAGAALIAAMRSSDDPGVRAAAAKVVGAAATETITSLGGADPTPTERPWTDGVTVDDQGAATALFKEGNALLNQRKWGEAASTYRRALARWDHPAIQYNLALALVNLDEPVELQRALAKAMRYGEAPLSTDKFERAASMQTLVGRQLAEISFETDLAGDTLVIDGAEVFTGPGRYQAFVRAGRHSVARRGAARAQPPRTIVLDGGATFTVTDGP